MKKEFNHITSSDTRQFKTLQIKLFESLTDYKCHLMFDQIMKMYKIQLDDN